MADLREARYKAQEGATYFFAVDRELVLDATHRGGMARYINHCCEPNCTARVATVKGRKRVIFASLKAIGVGEELTYDYRMAPELPAARIPCSCRAVKCRGFLNT